MTSSAYGELYRRVLWPAYEFSHGRATPNLLRAAQAAQWKTLEELQVLQWKELQKLLQHACEMSSWHKARFDSLGANPQDIRSIDDFRKLPKMTREEINQNREHILSKSYRGRAYLHRTGGSTGTPLHFYVNRTSYEWRVAMTMRGYGWADCRDGERQFYVWGEPIQRQPLVKRLKGSLHNVFLRRMIFSSFRFDKSRIQDCVRRINAFRPRTLVGYTNALYALAQFLLEHPQVFSSPQAIITGAEGVNEMQREVIEKALGAPLFSSYGSREFMLIGMECSERNGFHLSADNLLVEVVTGNRPVVGEVGTILVTDLHNLAFPFIRYEIGDLGIVARHGCRCGRSLPLLAKIVGRKLDVIRTPEGGIVPGEFFPHLMKEFQSVKQFQVVQNRVDSLQVKVVWRNGHPEGELKRIEKLIQEKLGSRVRLHLNIVPEIPLTPSGKFRVTVSEL